MRIGIYLGRHAGAGGGIGVYARSLVTAAVELLEEHGYQEYELVLYGERTILDDDTIEELLLSPVLVSVARKGLFAGANRYFRKLPNGARSRVLVRVLPNRFGRHAGYLLDQMLLPLYSMQDSLDVLHCAANYAMLGTRCPQTVTVHDLYQGWNVTQKVEAGEGVTAKIDSPRLVERVYRLMFRLQFRLVKHVITDAKHVAREIAQRFNFDPARISSIPLGLDAVFATFQRARVEHADFSQMLRRWLQRYELVPGYTLVFASSDPRKNLPATLEAWRALPEESRKRGLVLNVSDGKAQRIVWNILAEEYDEQYVQVVRGLARDELPFLYAGAAVTLVPTLAEGFGYPALEAIAAGSLVVSGPLEHLASNRSTENVFVCDPCQVNSIRSQLAAAIEVVSGQVNSGERLAARQTRAVAVKSGAVPRRVTSASVRTMKEVVRDTFSVYKEVIVRYKQR